MAVERRLRLEYPGALADVVVEEFDVLRTTEFAGKVTSLKFSHFYASLEEHDGELGGLVDAGREGPGRQRHRGRPRKG